MAPRPRIRLLDYRRSQYCSSRIFYEELAFNIHLIEHHAETLIIIFKGERDIKCNKNI